LNEVINNLSNNIDISVERGLAGIALGISYLVKEKFVEGDINEILEDVDGRIYKVLAFQKPEENKFPKPALLYLLHYLYVRYGEQSDSNGKYSFKS
jgi:hypothetical protein